MLTFDILEATHNFRIISLQEHILLDSGSFSAHSDDDNVKNRFTTWETSQLPLPYHYRNG